MESAVGVTVSDSALASSFTQGELRRYKNQFDAAKGGSESFLSVEDLITHSLKLGFHQQLTSADAQKLITDFEGDGNISLSFEGFLKLQLDLDNGTSYFSPMTKARSSATKDFLRSPMYSTMHLINESEKEAYVDHINSFLAEDPHVGKLLPIDPRGDALFEAIKPGILLCKLVNVAVPGTIDDRALNAKDKLNAWERNENHSLCLNSARAIGCQVVNIGTQDLGEGKEHLVLGLIAQIVKVQLLSSVNLKSTPALAELMVEEESPEEILNISSEKLLLRWMNHHLKKAGYQKSVTNFGNDLKDGEAYTLLLNQLAPQNCDLSPLELPAGLDRAEKVLLQAENIGCRKYLHAKDIVDGSQNLNLAFIANLFHVRNGLATSAEAEDRAIQQAELLMEDTSADSNEERVYMHWINSVGVQNPVTNLIRDVRDGYVLLEVLDKVKPGSVKWKRVAKRAPDSTPTSSRAPYQKLENCSQVIDIGRSLNFRLVNIEGNDIVKGDRKLILAFLWQLMRFHMFTLLQHLRHNHEVSDAEILQWANDRVRMAKKSSTMESFKDRSLSSGIFFLDLMGAVEPRVINWEIVTRGETDEEKIQNANYIISVARKLGCSIFLVAADIVKVQPKMILMLTASLMAFYLKHKAAKDQALADSLGLNEDKENGIADAASGGAGFKTPQKLVSSVLGVPSTPL